jgi:hypothetical protein
MAAVLQNLEGRCHSGCGGTLMGLPEGVPSGLAAG